MSSVARSQGVGFPQFRLERTTVKLRKRIGLWLSPPFLGWEYLMSDAAYGEWVIFQHKRPRFYYRSFDDRGNDDQFWQTCAAAGIDFKVSLVELLRERGFSKCRIMDRSRSIIEFSEGALVEVEVDRIVFQ